MSTAATPRVVRLRGGRVSARVRGRALAGVGSLVAVALLCAIASLGVGDVPISPGEVVSALLGGGDAGTAFVVRELRLPRIALALLVGGALGASGAIFQALTRNPLGSPDVIGFQTGAVTGALLALTTLSAGGRLGTTLGAVAGGTLTAAAVFVLARRDGTTQPFRLILVGIGMTAFTVALNEYLLARAQREEVQQATRWTIGSLGTSDWGQVVPLAVVAVVLAALLPLAARALRALELGDDVATGLGIGVDRARTGLVALGVLLVGAAVAAVGPIIFVALVAPQVARRVCGSASVPLGASALAGGTLLLAADLVGREVLPTPLPAGVVTGGIGGLYLAVLLSFQWRSGRA